MVTFFSAVVSLRPPDNGEVIMNETTCLWGINEWTTHSIVLLLDPCIFPFEFYSFKFIVRWTRQKTTCLCLPLFKLILFWWCSVILNGERIFYAAQTSFLNVHTHVVHPCLQLESSLWASERCQDQSSSRSLSMQGSRVMQTSGIGIITCRMILCSIYSW